MSVPFGDDESAKENCDENAEIVSEDEPHCDVVILTKSGRYTYFGNLDENNCRTGRGRTVSPDGFTSYEGYYREDKREGFGMRASGTIILLTATVQDLIKTAILLMCAIIKTVCVQVRAFRLITTAT